MRKIIAIYPDDIDNKYQKKIEEYLSLARKYHFNEVFTSLHLPEYSLQKQLKAFEMICHYAKLNGLDVSVDIGGDYISRIMDNKNNLEFLRRQSFDYLRLDYGYDHEDIKKLYKEFKLKGFIINASMYTKEKLEEELRLFSNFDDVIIRACHNYYPRKESGLDPIFALKQDSLFKQHEIPVTYCLPGHKNTRGPIHEGLCTIEAHRYISLREVICDLYLNYECRSFLFADKWLSEDEFREINHTLDLLNEDPVEIIKIKISFFDGVTEQEKKIVIGKHRFRYDSPFSLLRSLSSRQMAEYGSVICKNNTSKRKAGYITIDNNEYKRYSGELQVVLKDLEEDERVNVVAKISDPDDLVRLMVHKKDRTYEFVK